MRFLSFSAILILGGASAAGAIGVRMHAEIAEQAVAQFMGQAGEMLPGIDAFFANEENMRALYAGCAFPDWGYGGINPDAAEASHWNQYHTAYVQVIQQRFPPPWDAEAQKQIAFFLGIICHSIADIPWHFSAGNDKSFLQKALEQNGSGHAQAELAADLFLFAADALIPALPMKLYWPFDIIQEAFAAAGIHTTRAELTAGTTREQGYFFSGPMLALARAAAERKNHPWVHAHYRDYYYGGLDHNAAAVSIFFKYYYARLNGWVYAQNTPLYAEYVQHNGAYVPLDPVRDAHIIEALPNQNTGAEPWLELTGDRPGHARQGLLHFNLERIPRQTAVKKAVLWLYFAARRGGTQNAPKTIEAFSIDFAWNPGGGRSDPVDGIDGGPADDGAVTWNTFQREWQARASGQANQPLAAAIIRPEDPPGRWIAWDISDAVQHWVGHPTENHGILLREPSESLQSPAILQFAASDAFRCRADGFGGGIRVAWRPALVVIPHPPK